MSELAREARAAAKRKVERLTTADPHQKVDASSWTPPEPMHLDVQTGMRPVSRQARKRGGKVEGAKAQVRADRKPRGADAAMANAFVNRDIKDANEEREGIKHDGGFKRGGAATEPRHGQKRPGKQIGGSLAMLSPALMLANAMRGKDDDGPTTTASPMGKATGGNVGDYVPTSRLAFGPAGASRLSKGLGMKRGGDIEGVRPKGGREARASGGRAKGKTNINIIIDAGKGGQTPPAMPMPMPHPPIAGPAPMPMPPMGAGPPMPPPGLPPGMPPGGIPPMARKRGGRASYPLDAGSGSGEGRLEKAEAYGSKR